jgi:hypothetical protein
MVVLKNVQSVTVELRCKSYSGLGFHSWLKGEVHDVSVSVNAPGWAEKKASCFKTN